MSDRAFFDVDPATLHLPNERIDGADPAKLHRQIAKHGRSLSGMPPVLVYRGSDGELMLGDGTTRGDTRRQAVPRFSHPCRIARFSVRSGRPSPHSQGETSMSTITHDELIESLAELRQALPSMRLGQLIANMATVARGAIAGAVWEMEDDELLDAIQWQLRQLSAPVAAEKAEPLTDPSRME